MRACGEKKGVHTTVVCIIMTADSTIASDSPTYPLTCPAKRPGSPIDASQHTFPNDQPVVTLDARDGGQAWGTQRVQVGNHISGGSQIVVFFNLAQTELDIPCPSSEQQCLQRPHREGAALRSLPLQGVVLRQPHRARPDVSGSSAHLPPPPSDQHGAGERARLV